MGNGIKGLFTNNFNDKLIKQRVDLKSEIFNNFNIVDNKYNNKVSLSYGKVLLNTVILTSIITTFSLSLLNLVISNPVAF